MTDFRCVPDPQSVMQQCTFCGAPGHWAMVGFRGDFAPPSGHTLRADGTMDCPRSHGDRFEGAARLEWDSHGPTRAFDASGEPL